MERAPPAQVKPSEYRSPGGGMTPTLGEILSQDGSDGGPSQTVS